MICDSPGCSWAEGRPCIQKCCNPDEIYSFSRRECIKSKGALFRPIFYHDLSHKLSDSQQESVHPHYHIVFPRSFKYHCEENKTQIFPAGADFAHHLSNFTNRKYYSAQLSPKMRIENILFVCFSPFLCHVSQYIQKNMYKFFSSRNHIFLVEYSSSPIHHFLFCIIFPNIFVARVDKGKQKIHIIKLNYAAAVFPPLKLFPYYCLTFIVWLFLCL